jgi:hypothetical protein
MLRLMLLVVKQLVQLTARQCVPIGVAQASQRIEPIATPIPEPRSGLKGQHDLLYSSSSSLATPVEAQPPELHEQQQRQPRMGQLTGTAKDVRLAIQSTRCQQPPQSQELTAAPI